jgi:ubiquinone/menaquinone biosynthesis C-methylase UbiE
MALHPPAGLAGCGRLTDAAGEPLRPGDGAIVAELVQLSGLRTGARVLDVGCGGGDSLAWLERRGFVGVGVDRDRTSLALAASKTASTLLIADAARLPLSDGEVDAVLAECSLSLMADRRAALAEWRRVLKPGGRLLLADIDWPAPGGDPFRDDVAATGFDILHEADRSDVLAGFVARFVFQHGSLDALWGDRPRPSDKPRYRLLIAAPTGSPPP